MRFSVTGGCANSFTGVTPVDRHVPGITTIGITGTGFSGSGTTGALCTATGVAEVRIAGTGIAGTGMAQVSQRRSVIVLTGKIAILVCFFALLLVFLLHPFH